LAERTESAGGVTFVIFGASGDLTYRKLIPAIYALNCENELPQRFNVVGVARSQFGDDEFRKRLYNGVEEFSRIKPAGDQIWNQVATEIAYLRGEYDQPSTYQLLKEKLQALGNPNWLFYLATPAELQPVIIAQLGKAGLQHSASGSSRVVIEKPFGRDLQTAHSLNAEVHGVFDESDVYRIDHYLGKETVQNILTFRFGNEIFEPLWNRNHVDHVQITVAEDVGIEHRGGYYDETGVARDMLQNHLIQLLTLTAMDPPVAFNDTALRDEKVKVLRAMHPPSVTDSVWGQYEGYRDEPGVAKDSNTPTFVAVKMQVDNWRWQGVPFFLRTGKSLKRKATEVILQFKRVPVLLFPEDSDLTPNRISLCIQPDEGLHLRFEAKVPGAGMKTSAVNMVFHYQQFGKKALPEAYERLLLDAMHGDPSLFARSDEIETSWKLVDPLIHDWENQRKQPTPYAKGSWGPQAADDLIAQDGRRSWLLGCIEHKHHTQ
jgi:glucose-6-phosphate 1-dehydrogenase